MAIRLRSAALLVVGLVATALVAADSPPRNLKFVDGHWTAWDPPATMPEGAKVHVVEKGDTLSAIAKTYYGKASAYTKIFEANRDVLDDPDKIKPGQKLRIPD